MKNTIFYTAFIGLTAMAVSAFTFSKTSQGQPVIATHPEKRMLRNGQ